jgi:hypothetical protein
MTWYLASTRCKLTRAPPDRPAHRTHEEQLEGGIDRRAADRRDDTVHTFMIVSIVSTYYMGLIFSILIQLTRQHRIMNDVREIVRENPRGLSDNVKSRLKRIFQNAYQTAKTWSCGRADDVLLRQYNMPEAFSSRPSEARPSQGPPIRSTSMREHVCI